MSDSFARLAQLLLAGMAWPARPVSQRWNAAAGNAGQLEVARHCRLATLDGHVRDDDLVRVGVVDAHDGLAVDRADEPLVDRERAHRRGAVAAVALVVHDGRADLDLRERVVDVRAGPRAGADDAGLRERRDPAAHAVQLAAVWIGAAERGRERLHRMMQPPARSAARRPHIRAFVVENPREEQRPARLDGGGQGRIVAQPQVIAEQHQGGGSVFDRHGRRSEGNKIMVECYALLWRLDQPSPRAYRSRMQRRMPACRHLRRPAGSRRMT